MGCVLRLASLDATLLLSDENICPAVGFPLLLVQCSFAGGCFGFGFFFFSWV